MAPNNPPSKTLFLPELPGDTTEEVLERTFRGFVGFDSCRTRTDRNGKLVGFIEFENIDDAARCRDRMIGASPFPGINWHVHFSNSAGGGAPKRPREESGPPVPRHEAQRPYMSG
jgi:RNA recognition motif-containing protein